MKRKERVLSVLSTGLTGISMTVHTGLQAFAAAPPVPEGVEIPEGGFSTPGAQSSASATTFEMYCKIAVGVLAVLVIAALAVFIVRRKAISGKKSRLANGVLSGVSAILLAVIIAANWAASTYSSSIDAVFTKPGQVETDVSTTEAEWRGLVTDIADEGMVLLENKNQVLPLASGAKVNLLGYYAYNPYYSGSGSGSVNAADSIDIVTALTDAGIEVNTACVDAGIYPVKEAEAATIGFSATALTLDEIPISSYSGDASFENLKAYSDTAIVVIGRTGGEGYDLTGYEGGDYLALDENEEALLKAASETFDKVIVVLNTANALQMGFMDTYDIDACIWAGEPGPYGFESLGRILSGEVNPSGKLPDTWVYDHDSVPATENYAGQKAEGMENSWYVDYVEGIYVGYKWYETAYEEEAVITNTKTGETFDYHDYDSIVKYPFGYGLSYTTFDQKLTGGISDKDALDPEGTAVFEVTVTNTGNTAGKEAVQIYMSAPYTDYDKANGIEKSAVSLCGYGKTGLLNPGESEVVTVQVMAEDLASYDSSCQNEDGTQGAYMLDKGDYIFSVRSDAHTVLDEVTAVLKEDYFFSGENKRVSDDQQAYNQFADAARGEYLSRQDAFANYESAMNSVSATLKSTDWEDNTNIYDGSYDEVVTEPLKKGIDYAAKGDLTVDDVKGLSYDDEKWNDLIRQMTVNEMKELVTNALYASQPIKSIGKGGTSDSDGPLGISSMFNPDFNSVAYPCIPVLSATFNDELSWNFGAYVSDQAHSRGVTGWYAPAMDTHRSPYSGRNFEYYSEDGMLGAGMAAASVSGARDRGMIVYIKHFALNDMETNRGHSLHTYSTEQAIREIYLKPFEEAVKLGGATAVMSSMNYIGDIYAGGHEGLLTEVLRNEWGFRGKSLTDMDEGGEVANIDKCMRAGTDSWLALGKASFPNEVTDADIYYLQRAAHNMLYAEASGKTFATELINWNRYLTVACVELGMLILICIAAVIIRTRKVPQNS